jgi:spermidine synthase
MSQDWFLEKHTPHAGLSLEVSARLFDQRSAFQHIEVLETPEYGRVLLLDGCVMLTDRDEYVYHEMIVHPALLLHPQPREVLIVGGGDGGSVREALRHDTVQRVELLEIDEAVISAARRFFPALAARLDEPRVSIHCEDGFTYLDEHQGRYDLIVVDSIDPVGEAAKLFTSTFYEKVRAGLRAGGIAVFQTESPFYSIEVLAQVQERLRSLFRHVAPYVAHIPTYPSGLWSFTFASDAVDPLTAPLARRPAFLAELKYLTPELLRAAFVLPAGMARRLRH